MVRRPLKAAKASQVASDRSIVTFPIASRGRSEGLAVLTGCAPASRLLARSRSRRCAALLVGLEARGLDDRPPALVVGALGSGQFLAGRPRYLVGEGLDPGPDLGIAQGVEDRRSQALGNDRGRACGG